MKIIKIENQTLTIDCSLGKRTYRHWGSGPAYGWSFMGEQVGNRLPDKESEQARDLINETLKKYYKNR